MSTTKRVPQRCLLPSLETKKNGTEGNLLSVLSIETVEQERWNTSVLGLAREDDDDDGCCFALCIVPQTSQQVCV